MTPTAEAARRVNLDDVRAERLFRHFNSIDPDALKRALEDKALLDKLDKETRG